MLIEPRCACGHSRSQHSDVFGLCKGLNLPLPPDWKLGEREVSCTCTLYRRAVYQPASSMAEVGQRLELFERFIAEYMVGLWWCLLAHVLPLRRIRTRASRAVYDYEDLMVQIAQLGHAGPNDSDGMDFDGFLATDVKR